MPRALRVPSSADTDRRLDDLLSFLDDCPTPWHAAANVARRLEERGFERLDARAAWSLEPGKGYVCLHAGSSLVAFRVGARPPAEAGFRIAGAHTDSPGLRLKPRAAEGRNGHLLLDVEVYGSPILATWLDRDLALGGRVVVEEDGRLETRLVRTEGPVARIPSLAIHLDRGVNDEGLKLDRHLHLAPTLGLADGRGARAAFDDFLAGLLSSPSARVRGFDLALFDAVPAARLGLSGEFVASGRLDNLASCHAATLALEAAPPADATAVAVLFDHEEVGSETAEGAASAWLRDVLGRVEEEFAAPGGLPRALSGSLLVSADMAHAVHPTRADRHDGTHAPQLNGGPVVKTNAGRRYTTDAQTAAFFRSLCARVEVPCQEFAMRADLPCGSTIGPVVAARLGVRALDVGNPMLSMHSVRELCGTRDHAAMADVLGRFFGGGDPVPA
jgi:aspartyl aminopeptidase